jgi:hypothetical protein
VGGAEASTANQVTEEHVANRLQELLSSGGRLKDIASMLAKETGWASSDIYKLGLGIKQRQCDNS